jgi:hypothetical protein
MLTDTTTAAHPPAAMQPGRGGQPPNVADPGRQPGQSGPVEKKVLTYSYAPRHAGSRGVAGKNLEGFFRSDAHGSRRTTRLAGGARRLASQQPGCIRSQSRSKNAGPTRRSALAWPNVATDIHPPPNPAASSSSRPASPGRRLPTPLDPSTLASIPVLRTPLYPEDTVVAPPPGGGLLPRAASSGPWNKLVCRSAWPRNPLPAGVETVQPTGTARRCGCCTFEKPPRAIDDPEVDEFSAGQAQGGRLPRMPQGPPAPSRVRPGTG